MENRRNGEGKRRRKEETETGRYGERKIWRRNLKNKNKKRLNC